MMSAKGNRDFLSREWLVGTALSVERTYLGGQLALGEGVTLDYIDLVVRITALENLTHVLG